MEGEGARGEEGFMVSAIRSFHEAVKSALKEYGEMTDVQRCERTGKEERRGERGET